MAAEWPVRDGERERQKQQQCGQLNCLLRRKKSKRWKGRPVIDGSIGGGGGQCSSATHYHYPRQLPNHQMTKSTSAAH